MSLCQTNTNATGCVSDKQATYRVVYIYCKHSVRWFAEPVSPYVYVHNNFRSHFNISDKSPTCISSSHKSCVQWTKNKSEPGYPLKILAWEGREDCEAIARTER
jgi:hypothetical protein